MPTETLDAVVLDPISMAEFVKHVLDHNGAASTLIVCSPQTRFLNDLQASLATSGSNAQDDVPDRTPVQQAELPDHESVPPRPGALLSTPTLRMLASSRKVKVIFCPDITHLRAYLATFGTRTVTQKDSTSRASVPLLAILNPIELHKSTSAFSAQGLNRTFSLAVEAAHRTGSKLIIAEGSSAEPLVLTEYTDLAEDGVEAPLMQSLWDEEVSILNVTTKSFGAGDRGWIGRTVKLRRIAERWCTFETMSQPAET